MAKGYSFESFPAIAGVSLDTLYQWVNNFEDFAEAKREAFAVNRIFWEKIGIDGASGKIENFHATAWIFNMKNRFLWRDQRENVIEVSGLHGGPIQIANLNADERKKRLQIAQEKMKYLLEAVVVDVAKENETEQEETN